MAALTLEVGQVTSSTCNHCGEAVLKTTGFIFADGGAHAIYHAALHPHPTAPDVDLAIGVGTHWDAENAAADISAFIRAWPSETQINFQFVEPTDSVWSNSRLLAHQLPAAGARHSKRRNELLRIAALVVDEDSAVGHHLRHGAPKAGNLT